MKFLPLIFALVVPLAGCVTAEQQIALDDSKCQSYGVAKGSPAYVQFEANSIRTARWFNRRNGSEIQAAWSAFWSVSPRIINIKKGRIA